MGYASTLLASSQRSRRGGLASRWLADYPYHGGPPSGGAGGGLTRTTSGILFFDDFNRADGALGGSWTNDAGTWTISSNAATSSGGNFDRCRNTSLSTNAAALYEWRCRAPSGGIYMMPRLMAAASDDFHLDLKGDNTDKRLSDGAATDHTIASLTLTMDTSYHAVKVWYTTVPDGSRDFVVYFDRVAKLGSLASPFHSTTGPTSAGNPGLMGYGGAPLFDWILVSSGHLLTVTGLSGTQAFRLFDGTHTVIGSSSTQSGGSATLDLITLVDGLTTGTVEVYDSTSWGTLVATYPGAGTATDIAGGDSYALS
jgi:hypothetical protein